MIEHKLCQTPDGTYCPERATLALVGQKWVPHIVAELMRGTRRFNELSGLVGGCNSRTLRERLESLESLGVVHRTIVATMPPWVEYELTPSGRELGAALEPLRLWGYVHLATEALATERRVPQSVAPESLATENGPTDGGPTGDLDAVASRVSPVRAAAPIPVHER